MYGYLGFRCSLKFKLIMDKKRKTDYIINNNNYNITHNIIYEYFIYLICDNNYSFPVFI